MMRSIPPSARHHSPSECVIDDQFDLNDGHQRVDVYADCIYLTIVKVTYSARTSPFQVPRNFHWFDDSSNKLGPGSRTSDSTQIKSAAVLFLFFVDFSKFPSYIGAVSHGRPKLQLEFKNSWDR